MSHYHRDTPFLATMADRYSLCKKGSKKNTFHVVLNLEGSGIKYRPGDSFGIIPFHDPELVQKTLQSMNATGDEEIFSSRTHTTFPLRQFLQEKANITTVSKQLLTEIFNRQTNETKKAELGFLLEKENKLALKEYLGARELWDLLLEQSEVLFTPQELCDLLMPMLPRFYSIASSQHVVGDEVHFTVSELVFTSNHHQRLGVCSHYLHNLVSLGEKSIPVFVQPTKDFLLPENPDIPIIMIGPGTGVAPFRAFLQERIFQNATGKQWLFFGEWHRDQQFFYEEYWRELESQGKLTLDLAFSRDQSEKVYVQHRMVEKGRAFYEWIMEGAVIYVCGEAERMAAGVDHALHQIIKEHGGLSDEETTAFVKDLRKAKRYLRDVY